MELYCEQGRPVLGDWGELQGQKFLNLSSKEVSQGQGQLSDWQVNPTLLKPSSNLTSRMQQPDVREMLWTTFDPDKYPLFRRLGLPPAAKKLLLVLLAILYNFMLRVGEEAELAWSRVNRQSLESELELMYMSLVIRSLKTSTDLQVCLLEMSLGSQQESTSLKYSRVGEEREGTLGYTNLRMYSWVVGIVQLQKTWELDAG